MFQDSRRPLKDVRETFSALAKVSFLHVLLRAQ